MNDFIGLQKRCDEFNSNNPDRDKYFAFVAPSDLKPYYLFLENWNETKGNSIDNLKNGDFIKRTDWIKLPLEAFVTSNENLKIGFETGGIYIVKLKDHLKNSRP